MRPFSSSFFDKDQAWVFRVQTWDTPQSVLESDTSSEGMRLRVYQPNTEDTNWATYAAALKSVAANVTPETAFTNSTFATASVTDGRWGAVQAYWGSGTPNWWGGARAGRVALCYSGTLVPSARRAWLSTSNTFTFALAGSGWARIDVVEGTTRTTLFRGDLSETVFLSTGFSYSTTKALAEGAELHIYYVQTTRDPWGGLVVKAIPGTRPSDANLEAAAAAAPVVSCGLFSHGTAVSSVTLPFVLNVTVEHEPGSASRADIEIPLVTPGLNDGHGWVFYQSDPTTDPGALRVYDGGTLLHTLKRKRLIRVEVSQKTENAGQSPWMPIFTGHVDDFANGSDGRLTIKAVGFEGRLVEQYEQVPDRISYMGRGFRITDYRDATPSDRKKPVYNVPAFDNWPLAWAVEEMAVRSGIDPSVFRKPYEAVKATGSGAAVTLPGGAAAQRVRATALNGELVRLPRPVHYGNVGLSFTENRPYDDAYIFKVEPTKDNWARTRELTDKLGYTCRFDTTGAAVLCPTATPSFVRDLTPADVTSGAATTVTDPAAYGAKYLRVAATANATIQATVKASRIDISFPRLAGARPWSVTVTPTSGGSPVATAAVTPETSSPTPQLFFGSAVAAPGSNLTVYTAFSGDYGEYTVTLTTATSPASLAYVDCILAYAQDPDKPLLETLSTADLASSLTTRGQQDAVRNKVTIVGRRKAVTTDSEKFAEAQAPTEQEFVVQNEVDVRSITDRTASNYVGYLKQSVIYDESISDDGLARYLAQVFIYRQSVPRAGTQLTHTILPMLELGDPVAVQEAKFDTVTPSMTQYVSKITHTIGLNRFQTTIDTDAWPSYPAYQPRLDINLADFDNKPVVDLKVAYTSLSGHEVTNPNVDLIKLVSNSTWVEQSGVGYTDTYSLHGSNTGQLVTSLNISSQLAWPPVPGTFQIFPNYSPAAWTNPGTAQTNTASIRGPWNDGARVHVLSLSDDKTITSVKVTLSAGSSVTFDGTITTPEVGGRHVYFYYERRDGYVIVYRGTKPFSGPPSTVHTGTITYTSNTWTRNQLNGWLANNPYHKFVEIDYRDTPTGSRVTLPWQQLTGVPRDSGIIGFGVRYRSLYPNSLRVDLNGPKINGVSFSPFYDPYTSELGNLVSFKMTVLAEGLYRVSVRNWDDDTVVAWLTNSNGDPLQEEQHWEYMPVIADKQFTWDGVDQVGAWNAAQSTLYSELVQNAFADDQKPRVGRGFYCWNRETDGSTLGQLAYVWMERRSDGTPYIGQGTFARWYILIEAETTTPADTEVSSKDTNLAILTHLPEPTKLELQIQDYNPATSTFVTPAIDVPQTDVGAHINTTKPIRIRFRVADRPGALWANRTDDVSVKLTREVHLRAVIGDQFVVYRGKEYPGTSVEDRAVYNRRLCNDEHTRQYADTGYRKAKTFRWNDTDSEEAATEWVFYPQDFKKDFVVAGLPESIEFGNYLQLEEVPEWNGAREVSSARSRLHFAMMSYLFYLSAYVTDRSGRSSWGINRSFVDKSKIYANTTALDWPVDPVYEQRRTVVCRQWTKEEAWKTAQREQFGYDSNTLFSKLLEAFWWQYDISSNSIGTDLSAWSVFNLPYDPYAFKHATFSIPGGGSYNLRTEWGGVQFKLPSIYTTQTRQLGANDGTCLLGRRGDGTTQTGLWSWEIAPSWVPNITRDLHPFFLLPPMVSPPRPSWNGLANPTPEPGREVDYRNVNCYLTVGGPSVKTTFNKNPLSKDLIEHTVADAGGAETWTSPVKDFSITANLVTDTSGYITSTEQLPGFYPGYKVDQKEGPYKDKVTAPVFDYVRQDEMVHYEDLRGMYSRGKYPVGQTIKVTPSNAYYINPGGYTGFEVYPSLQSPLIATTHMFYDASNNRTYVNFFRTAFRSEYVWESGSLFPCARNGQERLEGVLWWRHRFLPSTAILFYDYGAWTGWKDDLSPTNPIVLGGERVSGNGTTTQVTLSSPFITSYQPVGVGPRLPQSCELVTHLVLVPSRRGGT